MSSQFAQWPLMEKLSSRVEERPKRFPQALSSSNLL